MKIIKLLILSFFIIGFVNQAFAQSEDEKPIFPAYFDLSFGASVTSFSNLDFPFGIATLNAGATINENFAVGIDYMSTRSGSPHFIKQFSGFGLQGRYVNKRILGKVTFGSIANNSINGELASLYQYADTFDFYGRIDIAYRFRKIWSVGISAYTSTLLNYDLYDYNEITERYDIYTGTSEQYMSGIAITLGMQLLPPYFQKS